MRAVRDEDAWVGTLWAARDRIASMPALVLWGLQDHVFTKHDLARWSSFLHHATVHTFAEVGHYPHEERPEEVTACIEAFLDDRSPCV